MRPVRHDLFIAGRPPLSYAALLRDHGGDMPEQQLTRPKPALNHEHTARCYWDLTECRWVCQPADQPEQPETSVRDGQ